MFIPPVWGIPVILVVGVTVVWYGWWADRRATARANAGYTAQSEVDAATGGTLLDDERLASLLGGLGDALSVPTRTTSAFLTVQPPPGHTGVSAPHGRFAALDHPLVLLADADLADPVALVPALRHARDQGRPLVLVARSLDSGVLDTLDANARTGRVTTLPLEASPEVIAQLSELTVALPLTTQDWQAGWLPAGAWGATAAWVADAERSWLTLSA